MATSQPKGKAKGKQAQDDDEDQEDQEDNGDDEDQENEGDEDQSDMTPAQKREAAFRAMVAKRKGAKK